LEFQVAGFWRRVFAAVIDSLALGIATDILAFLFRSYTFRLGPWGRLIGIAISLAYFGPLNSKLASGQTLGKSLLRIAVVDAEANHLSVPKSVLRAAILSIIFFSNGWAIPFSDELPLIGMFQAIILLGGLITLFYGFIFNRKTRQGPHDLLVGSYVVPVPVEPESTAPQRPVIHQRFLGGCLGLAAVLLLVAALVLTPERLAAFGIISTEEMQEIGELHEILSADDRFFTVKVNRGNRRQLGTQNVDKSLSITVWYKGTCNIQETECWDIIREIAEIAFAEYDGIEQLTGMRIRVETRYDLGLASLSYHQGIGYTISDWQDFLEDDL
jgi:uncharacterized RDD family membrane protein YckC